MCVVLQLPEEQIQVMQNRVEQTTCEYSSEGLYRPGGSAEVAKIIRVYYNYDVLRSFAWHGAKV